MYSYKCVACDLVADGLVLCCCVRLRFSLVLGTHKCRRPTLFGWGMTIMTFKRWGCTLLYKVIRCGGKREGGGGNKEKEKKRKVPLIICGYWSHNIEPVPAPGSFWLYKSRDRGIKLYCVAQIAQKTVDNREMTWIPHPESNRLFFSFLFYLFFSSANFVFFF